MPGRSVEPFAVVSGPPSKAVSICDGVGCVIPCDASSDWASESAMLMFPNPIGFVGGVNVAEGVVGVVDSSVTGLPLLRPSTKDCAFVVDPAKLVNFEINSLVG